ncbi:MAG TPA: serine kinase, partial [bacterium]|nr:serine kinase [bacterium]
MKLSEIIAENELTVFSPSKQPEVEIAHGYVSDMLSDVIANAGKDCVWMTMQTHSNVIAVAALKDMAGIIIVGGHKPSDETITLAKS